MSNQIRNLGNLRIAKPCPISWDDMRGDNRVRFCSHCQLNVYNISELSYREAEGPITSTEGRLCARLFMRSDGTVLTKDCPFGIKAIRRQVSRLAGAIFATITGLATLTFAQGEANRFPSRGSQQVRITSKVIDPTKQTPVLSGVLLNRNGAVIPAVNILLESKQGDPLKTVSDEEGKFKFDSMSPGVYLMRFEIPGFYATVIKDLIIETGHLTTLEVTMLEGVLVGELVLQPEPIDSPINPTMIKGEIIRRLPIDH